MHNQYWVPAVIRKIIIVIILVTLIGSAIFVTKLNEDEEAQLMADCLIAHKHWVVVSESTTYVWQSFGKGGYARPVHNVEYGCVD